MVSRPPKLTPWRDNTELQELGEWFYRSDDDDDGSRRKGVQRVQLMSTRGLPLPPSIEATAQLVSCQLLSSSSNAVGSYSLRLAYSMALVRFVNRQLDQFQQGQYALPLHMLARQIGLPPFFVELRHEATHESSLASLHLLDPAARRALQFLYDKYWSFYQFDNTQQQQQQESLAESNANQIKGLFREWRRLRRKDPLTVVKVGDNSDNGKVYWTLVNQIISCCATNNIEFQRVLLDQNVLIPTVGNKPVPSKVSAALTLFGPLLRHFDANVAGFADDLVGAVIKRLETTSNATCRPCLVHIAQYLLSMGVNDIHGKYSWHIDRTKYINSLIQQPTPATAKLIESFIQSSTTNLSKQEQRLQTVARQLWPDLQKEILIPDNDEPAKKKPRIDEIEKQVKLFKQQITSLDEDSKQQQQQAATTTINSSFRGWKLYPGKYDPRPIGVL